MGCLKLRYDYPQEQKFPSALRVAYSRDRENNFVPETLPQPKIIYFLLRIERDKNGEIIRVDSYALNNPLKYTDPDGNLIFLVPVAIGMVAGYYLGSSMYMHNYNAFSGSWWQGQKEGAWKAGVAGAIVGGAAGLGFSAAFGASLGITGMSAGMSGISSTGATTALWNITSNALITGSINTLSTGLQTGWDADAMYKSGLIGVGAGAIGGAVASSNYFSSAANRGVMSAQGIRAQNYVTNILSGAGDRLVRSVDAGLSTEDIVKNTIWGGVEGAISARMFSSDKFLNLGRGLTGNSVIGRYSSAFLSNSLTSNPGASFMAARIYGSVYPTWKLGQANEDLSLSINASLSISPFLYIGLSALQTSMIGPNYPYAYDFLNPDYSK